MSQLSLPTTIFSFAFSGVLAPHRREYEPSTLRPQTPAPTQAKKK